MAQQSRNECLFYYFCVEEQIPEDHLLRLIDRYLDLGFVREQLKSELRVSIDGVFGTEASTSLLLLLLAPL